MLLPAGACLWFALTAPVAADTLRAPSDDEAAVTALVARYHAARAVSDSAAIQALFTPDADQLVSTGVWRRGRATLVEGMLESSRANPGERTLAVASFRLLSPDVALADARYEIAGVDGAEPRRMWSTFVAVRTGTGWRIAAIRNMFPSGGQKR